MSNIVYVLINEAMPGYVKIGITDNLERRIRELDNTSIPLPFECFYACTVESAANVEKLIHMVRDHHPNSEILLYQTMARRYGDPQNAHHDESLASFVGMQCAVNAGYDQLAKQFGATLVPLGTVWLQVRSDYPSWNLYDDDIHPSLLGAYIAACVFFVVLFHQPLAGAWYPDQMDVGVVQTIHQMIAAMVAED